MDIVAQVVAAAQDDERKGATVQQQTHLSVLSGFVLFLVDRHGAIAVRFATLRGVRFRRRKTLRSLLRSFVFVRAADRGSDVLFVVHKFP